MKRGKAVADTDILIALSRAEIVSKLANLFSEVHLPKAVRRELRLSGHQRRSRSFEKFLRFATHCDRWDKTVFVMVLSRLQRSQPKKSHQGESQAIAQAVLHKEAVLLTDDKGAREAAEERGLLVLSSFMLARMISGDIPSN